MPPLARVDAPARTIIVMFGRIEKQLPARAFVKTGCGRKVCNRFPAGTGAGENALPFESHGQGYLFARREIGGLTLYAVEINPIAIAKNANRMTASTR